MQLVFGNDLFRETAHYVWHIIFLKNIENLIQSKIVKLYIRKLTFEELLFQIR